MAKDLYRIQRDEAGSGWLIQRRDGGSWYGHPSFYVSDAEFQEFASEVRAVALLMQVLADREERPSRRRPAKVKV